VTGFGDNLFLTNFVKPVKPEADCGVNDENFKLHNVVNIGFRLGKERMVMVRQKSISFHVFLNAHLKS
jgi:hypothetical protein